MGALAASVAVDAHTAWSGPAFAAGLPGSNTVMVIWSDVLAGEQAPLLMVHCSTVTPGVRPLTVVVGLLGLAKEAVPLTTDHVPDAGNGAAFAASVALLAGMQSSWSGPAFAAGCALLNTVMVTSSDVAGTQAPLEMV